MLANLITFAGRIIDQTASLYTNKKSCVLYEYVYTMKQAWIHVSMRRMLTCVGKINI